MNFLSEQSESVVLTGFHSHGENILVLVETTVTPAQKKIKRRDSSQRSLQKLVIFLRLVQLLAFDVREFEFLFS